MDKKNTLLSEDFSPALQHSVHQCLHILQKEKHSNSRKIVLSQNIHCQYIMDYKIFFSYFVTQKLTCAQCFSFPSTTKTLGNLCTTSLIYKPLRFFPPVFTKKVYSSFRDFNTFYVTFYSLLNLGNFCYKRYMSKVIYPFLSRTMPISLA